MNTSKKIFNKHSQIFIIDLILASVIIIVTFGVVLSTYLSSESQRDLFDIAFRASNSMASIGINDLNNDFVRELFVNQQIQNIDNTLLQQVSEFYVRGQNDLGQQLAEQISEIYFPSTVSFEIELVNITNPNSIHTIPIYNRTRFGISEDSSSIASIEKQIIVFTNDDIFFHRYDIRVWRN